MLQSLLFLIFAQSQKHLAEISKFPSVSIITEQKQDYFESFCIQSISENENKNKRGRASKR